MKHLITFCVGILAIATAYTQNVGVGTNKPLARLHVADSSVLYAAAGAYVSPNDIAEPASVGASRRMLWYADKGAFRAGYSTSTDDRKDSIGLASIAMGAYAKARGDGALAIGNSCQALGNNSAAIGTSSYAKGEHATAIGFSAVATGYQSASMGGSNEAVSAYTLAMGNKSTASSDYAVAIGFTNKASGFKSLALGNETVASGLSSTAAGFQSKSIGANSTASGYRVEANTAYELVVGMYNLPYAGNANIWQANDPIFSVGNGKDASNKSTAITVLKNGSVGIGVLTPHAPLQFGNGVSNRKLVLYETKDNEHEFYGLGVTGYVFRYQVDNISANHIFYAASSATTSNELMRIQGNGKVGIGTNTPDQLLTVNGNASKPGGGNWLTFSDSRLKKNIETYTGGLREVMAINPVTFQYNEQSGYTDLKRRYVGILAQDIEKVMPNTVSINMEGGMLRGMRQFDGSELTFALINAIKEQQAQLDAAATSLAEMELLKKKVLQLESLLQAMIANLDKSDM